MESKQIEGTKKIKQQIKLHDFIIKADNGIFNFMELFIVSKINNL